jgi:hypothetical protein
MMIFRYFHGIVQYFSWGRVTFGIFLGKKRIALRQPALVMAALKRSCSTRPRWRQLRRVAWEKTLWDFQW